MENRGGANVALLAFAVCAANYRKTRPCTVAIAIAVFCQNFETTLAMAARFASRSRSPVPVRTPQEAQSYVQTLQAADLLELCCWLVTRECVCEDSDCDCEGLECYKAGRFHNPVVSRPPACDLKAARVELKRRCLCHCCGKRLVPIADARANGTARHRDWPTRRYHKKCYNAALRGEFGQQSGLSETDVED